MIESQIVIVDFADHAAVTIAGLTLSFEARGEIVHDRRCELAARKAYSALRNLPLVTTDFDGNNMVDDQKKKGRNYF